MAQRGRGRRMYGNHRKDVENNPLAGRNGDQHQINERDDEVAKLGRQVEILIEKVQHFHPFLKVCEDSKSKLEYNLKLENQVQDELPPFFGSFDAIDLEEWINTLERVFEYHGVFEKRKVKLVTRCLKGVASEWWKQVQKFRQWYGKGKIREWEKMKKKLKKKFSPSQEYDLVQKQQNWNFSWSGQQVQGTYNAGQQYRSQPRSGNPSHMGRGSNVGDGQYAKTDKAVVPPSSQPYFNCMGVGKQSQGGNFMCFKCGETGHKSSYCQKDMNKVLLMEEVETFVPEIDFPVYNQPLNEKVGDDFEEALPIYDEEVGNSFDEEPIYDHFFNEEIGDNLEEVQPNFDKPLCEEFIEELEEEWLRENMLLPKKDKVISKPPTTSLFASKSFNQTTQESGFKFAINSLETVVGNGILEAVCDLLQPYMVDFEEQQPIYDEPHDVHPLYDQFSSEEQDGNNYKSEVFVGTIEAMESFEGLCNDGQILTHGTSSSKTETGMFHGPSLLSPLIPSVHIEFIELPYHLRPPIGCFLSQPLLFNRVVLLIAKKDGTWRRLNKLIEWLILIAIIT